MANLSARTVVGTLTLAYGPACLLGIAAIIPGLNYIYSGHGGLAWLLLPFALPFAVTVLIIGATHGPVDERTARMKLAWNSIIAYAPISLIFALAGSHSIESTFGLRVEPWEFWTVFMSPLWLLFAF